MQLYTVGINHTTAPIAIREKVAFDPDHLSQALLELMEHKVSEAAILSTCNRSEIYATARDPKIIIDWLCKYHGIKLKTIESHLYVYENQEAVQHAFRVASGLDSMVLGEPQILGQMKQAIKTAENTGTLGALLNKLFQKTFSVAKEVRTKTDIGMSSISMAAASIKLAESIFGDLKTSKVLLIGAGEMIELCAEHIKNRQPKSMTVANRSLDRGLSLAKKIKGDACLISELSDRLHEFDIVLSSTASQLPIVGLGMVERALKTRRNRPMFMVDLAVPRDIEPEVGKLSDVYLYTVDDLSHLIEEGLTNRQSAAIEAQKIIDHHVKDFTHWLKTRTIVPTIKALRDHAESYRVTELKKAQKLLNQGMKPEEVLEVLSKALANKFVHHPSQALNEAKGEEHELLTKTLKKIYPLKD
ncbi:glutamyl tRNA reductase [Candidatus Methylopumilus planktonicus]|uniref:Glutamyl-tRNA reductase n=1 Tax=Candidatus Methylopumilus planktonicus TaxID=1581557 RepID=A0A0D6EY41_9PROT|nr:glutamyl-tRNA reductase [Candidatus Methylopumilus planktonicus]CEZ20178.1 glutamyl tRNA reductase [Candidatus Methylopumilus planktonicus]